MFRKTIVAVMALLMVLVICACDNNAQGNMFIGVGGGQTGNAPDIQNAGDETSGSATDGNGMWVSVSQQEEDIIKNEQIQNCYTSQFVPTDEYELISYGTTRQQRNEEEKKHIIYSDVVIQEYNYYDVGGWFLDSVTIEQMTVNVAGPADVSLITEALKDEQMEYEGVEMYCTHEDSVYKVSCGTGLTGDYSELAEDHTTMNAHVVFENKVLQIKGYYVLDFTQETGWCLRLSEGSSSKKIMTVTSYTSNYEAATGTFRLQNLIYNKAQKLNILSITDESISYTLDGVEFTSEFDPLSGKFDFVCEKTTEGNHTTIKSYGDFTYDPYYDRWEEDSTYNGRTNYSVIRE